MLRNNFEITYNNAKYSRFYLLLSNLILLKKRRNAKHLLEFFIRGM